MSKGLRIWGADGRPTLTVTDRITRLIGSYTAVLGVGAVFVDVGVPGCTPQTHCAFNLTGVFYFEIFSGFVRCHRIRSAQTGGDGGAAASATFHVAAF